MSIDPTIKFIWVGDGDEDERSKLESAGVTVMGWIPKSEVWGHLLKAQVYLSTARWEGMPVSVIEASFAGLPVIASNCSGNIDVVQHDKTGWLFESTEQAIHYIVLALNDSDLSATQSTAAQRIAQERFSVERYISEMNQLIKNQSRIAL
ncbi:putative teichuronic acid biosynthesis glycosyltransferase TuaC [compost metagenome]